MGMNHIRRCSDSVAPSDFDHLYHNRINDSRKGPLCLVNLPPSQIQNVALVLISPTFEMSEDINSRNAARRPAPLTAEEDDLLENIC